MSGNIEYAAAMDINFMIFRMFSRFHMKTLWWNRVIN